MKAVHFGAGNIGRGFVGLLLHEAGYEVVFADVNAELIDTLAAASSYRVLTVGEHGSESVVTGFRAVNSQTDEAALVAEIASADVVTTAVGVRILPFVAPAIAAGLVRRASDAPPLAVMACENAVGASDALAASVRSAVTPDEWDAIAPRAVFANTAVDRIVPAQPAGFGIDVMVETFYEWVVDRTPFTGVSGVAGPPPIAGVTYVDDLEPYVERKLYTVNTGHATVAYLGWAAGAATIADAMDLPAVRSGASRALAETSAALVAKHGLDADALAAYRAKILGRFENVHLHDAVERVGREPLRKLGRYDRFIGPAAELAERGTVPTALLEAIGAALRFDVGEDAQSQELGELLRGSPAGDLVTSVTALAPEHPLFASLVSVFEAAAADRARARVVH
jgi:mannitol-1-phosphate 5-dehydrogenase